MTAILSSGVGIVHSQNQATSPKWAKQPGVTNEVQSAGSLLPALPDSFSATSTTVLINDATTLKVRDNVLITTAPGRFLRVKVTAAP